MTILFCENGQHDWNRPAQRGRPPLNCPDHPKPTITNQVAAELRNHTHTDQLTRTLSDRPSARILGIQELLDNRQGCTCQITATMSDRDLMRVRSCNDKWECSTLDRIRRQYVDYTNL